MGKLLRDFRCHQCSRMTERFIEAEANETRCPHCGGVAIRIIGMPTVKLEGITGAFPGAHDKWARIREDNARIKAAKRQE